MPAHDAALPQRTRLDGVVFDMDGGDDIPDEDAFKAIAKRGLGIVVRGEENRPTAATLAVSDMDEVRRVLNRLAADLDQP